MKSFITCLYQWVGVMILDYAVFESDFWDELERESNNFSQYGWLLDGWLIAMTDNHRKVFWFRLNQITHPY
jgi:hypothetical protein